MTEGELVKLLIVSHGAGRERFFRSNGQLIPQKVRRKLTAGDYEELGR